MFQQISSILRIVDTSLLLKKKKIVFVEVIDLGIYLTLYGSLSSSYISYTLPIPQKTRH